VEFLLKHQFSMTRRRKNLQDAAAVFRQKRGETPACVWKHEVAGPKAATEQADLDVRLTEEHCMLAFQYLVLVNEGRYLKVLQW
jgi:hypothetical protein